MLEWAAFADFLVERMPVLEQERIAQRDLLAGRGDLDQAVRIWRARADAGDRDAGRLAELLMRPGQGEEAQRLRRFGLNPDGSIACG